MSRLKSLLAPVATALGATADVLAYKGAPSVFDEWLALPLAVETAHPGTYPASDLLVHGSLQGPFHLYKAMSLLWTLGVDTDVAWYALLAGALIAFFLAAWRVAGACGLSIGERALLVGAIAATPVYRGTLNWSAQPMLSFITASVAVPIGLLAVAFALEQRPRLALALAALAFDIHPSLGLCAGLAVIGIIEWRRALPIWRSSVILAVLLAAPNVVYLLLHRPVPVAGAEPQLWEIFRTFGYHTFIRDHWRDGYPWYALALSLAIMARQQTTDAPARWALRGALTLTAAAAAWILVMNFAPVPALIPLYLVRASWLAKPLVMSLALLVLTRRTYGGRYAFLAPWAGILAVAHPDRMVAEGALAVLVGMVLLPAADRRLATLGFVGWTLGVLSFLAALARQAPLLDATIQATNPLRWMMFALGIACIALLLSGAKVPQGEPRAMAPRSALALAIALPLLAVTLVRPAGRMWLPDSASAISVRLHLSRALPKEAGAMGWARSSSPPGSLFAIPPIDANWVRFRLASQRGAYVTVHDINQLMYVPKYVLPAVARLATLGVVTKGPHNFDARPYWHPTCARLQRMAADGADYYVLPAEGTRPEGSVVSFQDANYTILDVKRTAQGCRLS